MRRWQEDDCCLSMSTLVVVVVVVEMTLGVDALTSARQIYADASGRLSCSLHDPFGKW
jgi:hypothetical protein